MDMDPHYIMNVCAALRATYYYIKIYYISYSLCTDCSTKVLRNKVTQLLGWVKVPIISCSPWSSLTGIQGGKKKNVRSPLGHIIDEDPALFASISGKLDAVAGFHKEAIAVKDSKDIYIRTE